MGFDAGTRLEHYEILAPLGAGGMGEVYRAFDGKLKRDVALKLLPDRFARDAARLLRFEREAVVLANLNHPNIAAIYGLENSNGTRFLVLELVEGSTLAERINSGPIPVSEAIAIAIQIAEGLEAAHEKGVVHRDLKPANIKLTAGGKVKVLDFGLAKALSEPDFPADPSNSPTITMQETAGGVVMGTASYMSPEQAEGKPVDKRADVWAFGVVLFEMLTGQRLFDGKSTSHIIVRVMEQEPDWSKLPPLPAGVQDLLERCLQKDPAQRLRDIGDVRIQLQAAITKPLQATARAASETSTRRWLWPVAASIVVLSALAFFVLRREPPAAREVTRFEIPQPENTNASNFLALSPDGRRLAFIASTGGESRLWVRSLETLEARPLAGTEGIGGLPFWSADGRYLTFSAQRKLKKIEATGGPAQSLTDVANVATSGFWTSDGRIVYGDAGRGLFEIASSGGPSKPFLAVSNAALPTSLPNGNFAYCQCQGGNERGIYVMDGGKPRRILPDESAIAYSPSDDPKLGYLLFVRGAPALGGVGTLMAQPIDVKRLTAAGDPIPVADQVIGVGFSSSTTGDLVYRSNSASVPLDVPGMVSGQLTWFDRKGTIIATVGDKGVYRIPALSLDGKLVAIEESDPATQNMDVYLFEFARGIHNRFTFHANRDVSPLWSVDGKQVLFTRLLLTGQAGAEWYRKSSNLAGDEELLFKISPIAVPSTWSPDGRFVLATGIPAPADILALDLSAKPEDRKTVVAVSSPGNDVNARFSPDGKWFSYASNEAGPYEINVRPFNGSSSSASVSAGGKIMVSKGGATAGGAVWRADGKELFYVAADQTLMSVEVTTVPTFNLVGIPKPLFKVPEGVLFFDVSRDGQRFIMPVTAAAGVSAPAYKVILNWTSTLKK